MLIAKKRDDADPMVGQPTPKEAERIRKEILRLRGIPEVDRYIAKAGEEGRSLLILRVYHMMVEQARANLRPLILYGFARACYEYKNETSTLMFTELLERESLQWKSTLKHALMQLKAQYSKHPAYMISSLIYIYIYRDHPKYKSTFIKKEENGMLMYIGDDNMPEVLLPIIREIESVEPDHPLVLYLKELMLFRSTQSHESSHYIYSSIYNSGNMDRLPFLNRLFILFDLYFYFTNKKNQKMSDKYANEMVQLIIKTWNIYPTQHYFVFNVERWISNNPNCIKLLNIIRDLKRNNGRLPTENR
jgi:hypothetical protein